CPREQSVPALTGCSGFPSSLIARASRVLTWSPQPAAHSVHVDAYQVATPGTCCSDCTMYGTSLATRSVEHPERAAVPAPLTPSTFRNCRRSTPAFELVTSAPLSRGEVGISVVARGAIAGHVALQVAVD